MEQWSLWAKRNNFISRSLTRAPFKHVLAHSKSFSPKKPNPFPVTLQTRLLHIQKILWMEVINFYWHHKSVLWYQNNMMVIIVGIVFFAKLLIFANMFSGLKTSIAISCIYPLKLCIYIFPHVSYVLVINTILLWWYLNYEVRNST